MPSTAPIIVLGAGHNGLTAAATLAKHGRQVLVLERRMTTGGIAATEPLIPGYQFNTGFANAAGVRTEIIKDLRLDAHGFEPLHPQTALAVAGPDGLIAFDAHGGIRHGADRLSAGDDERMIDLVRIIRGYGEILSELSTLTPPNIKGRLGVREVSPWARLGLGVRRRGGRAMMDLLRTLPSSAREFLDEHLSSDAVKGGLAVFSTLGAFLGPYGSGSTLNLLYQFAGGFGPVFLRGGAGRLSSALQEAVIAAGGEVRLGTAVRQVTIENGRAAGVVTSEGEEIRASAVVSSLDPRTTFSGLLSPGQLPVKFTRRLSSVRFKGTTATVHFTLDRLPDFGVDPEFLDGWITFCPSVDHLERAYDSAKYGRVSPRPALLVTIPTICDPGLAEPGHHTLTAVIRYAPYHLKEGDYARLHEIVMETLSGFAPDFRAAVRDHRTLTPRDYEEVYGLAEGNWMHGQMGLDQQLVLRPVPGWSDYRSPVPGLWLCGSGSHPGGGITCAPGRNAAREILKDG
jgi:phytoene dehydrogenase-like protein